MKNFIQVKIGVEDPVITDQMVALFTEMQFEGFEETKNELIAYVEEEMFDAGKVKEICETLDLAFSSTIIPHQNWNALWESNFEPVVVDDFCTVRADFHPVSIGTEHDILITPKMSFGTGHHATTFLMLQEMRQIDFRDKSVADFGTGTGILAIMAEKLGASKIVAIDYDDWSIENTKENIERNDCKVISVLKAGEFNPLERFDIILANINKNVIVENLNNLVNGLTTGGSLLLSGLLKTDETEVVTAFEKSGLEWKHTKEKNNWITILLKL